MSARRLPIHIFTIYLHFNMMSIQTVRARHSTPKVIWSDNAGCAACSALSHDPPRRPIPLECRPGILTNRVGGREAGSRPRACIGWSGYRTARVSFSTTLISMTTFLRIICCAGSTRLSNQVGFEPRYPPSTATWARRRLIRMPVIGCCFGIRSGRRLCDEVHLNPAYRWDTDRRPRKPSCRTLKGRPTLSMGYGRPFNSIRLQLCHKQ